MLSRADAHQAAVAREELQGGVVTPLPEAQRVSTERIHEQMLAILALIKDKLKEERCSAVLQGRPAHEPAEYAADERHLLVLPDDC